ncbi:MAG: thioesterase family protein [Pseudomonadota bacterium]
MAQTEPFQAYEGAVLPQWVDYNGHMNVAYYLVAFDEATDLFFDHIGLNERNRQLTGGTTFAAEVHLAYQREILKGDPIRITTQLLAYDAKRMRFYHRMFHGTQGYQAATMENVSLHVNLSRRKVEPMPEAIVRRLSEIMAAHRDLPLPENAGHGIEKPPLEPGHS